VANRNPVGRADRIDGPSSGLRRPTGLPSALCSWRSAGAPRAMRTPATGLRFAMPPRPGICTLQWRRPAVHVSGRSRHRKRGYLQSGSAGLDDIERQPAVRLPVGASLRSRQPARVHSSVRPVLHYYSRGWRSVIFAFGHRRTAANRLRPPFRNHRRQQRAR
jgi:hypothetical protein